jgi:peroxiredoxin
VQYADALKAQGIDEIVCVAVNDAMVLAAWARERDAVGKISMLADGLGEFTRAVGLEQDLSNRGFGMRSMRYAMLIEDGIVANKYLGKSNLVF